MISPLYRVRQKQSRDATAAAANDNNGEDPYGGSTDEEENGELKVFSGLPIQNQRHGGWTWSGWSLQPHQSLYM